MAVTIRDIARIVGVSRGTVDRVINGRGNVKHEVAVRILEVMNEKGYVPNKAGKVLVTRKKPIKIGCFLPAIGNAFFDDVINGFTSAESELKDFGLTLNIKTIHGYEVKNHIKAITELVEDDCSAICVSTIDVPEIRNLVNDIIDAGIPIIAVNTDISDTNRLCYIGSNYLKGGRTAGKLLSMFSNFDPIILTVTGSYKIIGHVERIKGFIEVLDENKVPYRVAAVCESWDDDEYAYNITLKYLREYPEINCVYVSAAGTAGVCKAVAKSRIRQKHQFHVIAFDDTDPSKQFLRSGEIDFTICQEPHRQGYQAILTLFNYFLENKKTMPQDCFMDTVIKISENL